LYREFVDPIPQSPGEAKGFRIEVPPPFGRVRTGCNHQEEHFEGFGIARPESDPQAFVSVRAHAPTAEFRKEPLRDVAAAQPPPDEGPKFSTASVRTTSSSS
jgi:hypothetical protein